MQRTAFPQRPTTYAAAGAGPSSSISATTKVPGAGPAQQAAKPEPPEKKPRKADIVINGHKWGEGSLRDNPKQLKCKYHFGEVAGCAGGYCCGFRHIPQSESESTELAQLIQRREQKASQGNRQLPAELSQNPWAAMPDPPT